MKGRDRFTAAEVREIREELGALRTAEREEQKRLRRSLRAIGFHISDWSGSSAGFTRADFDELVERGSIGVVEGATATATPPTTGRTLRSTGATAALQPTVGPQATGSRDLLDTRVASALSALRGARYRLPDAAGRVPSLPGLYAIYGSGATWAELGLGDPPDDRPLYVGRAEASLASRDLGTHFGDGHTGSSTVRRSFAALLREPLALRGQPRNTANPGRYASYGLSPDHDAALTEWMWRELALAVWVKPPDVQLLEIERALLGRLKPPLNLKDVTTPWSESLSAARRAMADEARAWASAPQ